MVYLQLVIHAVFITILAYSVNSYDL